MRSYRRLVAVAAVSLPAMLAIGTGTAGAVAPPGADVFISELHYDNASTDVGEAIEIFGPTCTDLTGWSIELYNGNGGGSYGTAPLSGFIGGTGYGTVFVDFPSNGIQNGPDGLALIDAGGGVRQFLSYEGVLTATDGPATGLESTDIGVLESSSTPVGDSLQLSGSGELAGDFTWVAGADNFGDLGLMTATGTGGDPSSCDGSGGGGPLADVVISEIHYDNASTDVDERIEVTGPAGTDLTGWTIVLYRDSGTVYNTSPLSGVLGDDGAGSGAAVVSYPSNGIQNGPADGMALVGPGGELVELLSYEGTLTATDGPAAGLTSTDVGVSEGSSTSADQSLQRIGDIWSGPLCNSFGVVNDPAAPADCPEPAPAVINAALISTTSTDVEYVELFGTPGLSLAGMSVIGVESDDQSTNGNIDHRYDLPADAVIGDNGFFLLGNQYVQGDFGVTPDFELPDNALENSSITLGLVETASITGGTAADVDPAGIWDTVGVTDGGPTDSFAFGAPVVGPDGSFLPAGVRRITDGVDTDTAADWTFLVFSPRNDPANMPTSGDTGGGGEPDLVKIHEIQGNGAASLLDGDTVLVEGIVVGAPDSDPDGVYETFGGFYLQEEDADADADPLTSEGIFVFASGDVTVDDGTGVRPIVEGDQLRVIATVDEFSGLTELTAVTSIEFVAAAMPLPTAIEISLPLAPGDDLERYEGMLVTFPQTLTVSEYFNFDRFGETVVALPAPGQPRPMNPGAVHDEDSAEAVALQDLNSRSRITIDDGQTSQNPSEPVHPFNRELFSQTNAFRGGDTVSGLTGPLHYAFGQYRLMPLANGAGFGSYVQTVAPASPDDVGGDLTVASLNALNYFLTLDGSGSICGADQQQGCRGADDAGEFERQRVKLLNALEGLDADVIGLNEVENTPGVDSLGDLAAGLNDRLGAGTYAAVEAGTNFVVGGDAIKVGLIYRTAAVSPLGAAAVLDTPEFIDPNNTGSPKNRAAVAQTFVDSATGEVFSVVVNHLKSKGSSCGAGDDHPIAGSCNVTRTLAAQELAAWIDTDPTGTTDDDWLIIGDLNSYDQEDPISALAAAGYTDLIAAYQGEFAYSYVFSGEFGYLDYLMSSPSMTSQVTGATEWHINADEPDVFDYDTSFKSDYQDNLFDPTTPFRASDHDAALVGLSLTSSGEAVVSPDFLWPVNYRMREVMVTGVDNGAVVPSEILAITSSEADSGLRQRDRGGDIEIVSDTLALLRAESYDLAGRTYTISVRVDADGQVSFRTVEVSVPGRRGGPWR